MEQTTQDMSEMIIVCLNNINDGDLVESIFFEMTQEFKLSADQTGAARLLKSASVENEWAICLHHSERDNFGKSNLADRLAGVLRSIGLVHRSVWKHCDVLPRFNHFHEAVGNHHSYNVESYKVGRHVNEKHDLPFLKIETDYFDNDEGQIRTKIEAIFEMAAN